MATEPSQISEREREILRLVAMGATNQQIAHQLNISVNTVKVHLRNIFGKIGAASRTEATVYAIQMGLVNVGNRADLAPAPPQAAESFPDLTPAGATTDPAPLDTPGAPLEWPPLEPETVPDDVPARVPDAGRAAVGAEPAISGAALPSRRRALPIALAAMGLVLGVALAYTLLQQQQGPGATATAVPTTPQPNLWKSRAPMPQARADFAVTAYDYDGKVYVIGGSAAAGPSAAVERYDPSTNIWVPLNDKPTPVSHVQAVTVRGLIYVPGGEGKDGSVLNALEAYDPRTKQWEALPSLPEPRSRYALAGIEGRLYLLGGWDGSRYRAELFIYDPASQKWSSGAPLPTPRRNAGAAVAEGRIYVIGGENESGPLRVNERYDPTGSSGGQWESAVPLPGAVAMPAVVGVVNTVLVFDPQLHTAMQYSPATDAWTPIRVPENTAVSARAAALNTSIFVFGPPSGDAPVAVGEYQAGYTLFLPGIGVSP